MFKKTWQLSWIYFVLLNALFITAMNSNLFSYIYTHFDEEANILTSLSFPVLYFCICMIVFSLLYLPYLSKLLSCFLILATCLSSYFMHAYGIIIDKDMLDNVFKSDPKEIKELITVKMILFILLLGILPCVLVLKTKLIYGTFKKHLSYKIIAFVLSSMLLLIVFLPQTRTIVPFFRTYKEVRVYNAPFYQIYSLGRYFQRKFTTPKEFKIIAADAKLEAKKPNLLILVIGETARAKNYSLGGYTDNETNFYTSKQGVVYFSDISSCGTSTAISLPCMFYQSTKKEYSGSIFEQNALDILQNVGVNTFWIDNNTGACQGVCDRLENKLLMQESYDEAILEKAKVFLNNLKEQNLLVIHLQGSHGPSYYKRYPKEFEKFSPTCKTNELQNCSFKELVNTYDNTLLYTDFIISELIKLAQEQKDYQSSVLYLSDHGESLGENGIYLHSMPYILAPREQTHVPMIFYTLNENLQKLALKHKDLKLSHDNLFHTLLGYFEVKTKVYDEKLDILSSKLKSE